MTLDEFTDMLQDLANAFGASLKAERIDSYYDVFHNVSAINFKSMCSRMKLNADRFPSIKDLCLVAYEIRAFGDRGEKSDYSLFVCDCGGSFTFSRKRANENTHQTISCPNCYYEFENGPYCNKKYEAGYLLNHSVEV